jgi:hypothetical protein
LFHFILGVYFASHGDERKAGIVQENSWRLRFFARCVHLLEEGNLSTGITTDTISVLKRECAKCEKQDVKLLLEGFVDQLT